MPTIKIQRRAVERLLPAKGNKPEYYFDETLKGFAIRVSPEGVKAFLVQGRIDGKLYRKSLGRWPTVLPDDARKRARAILDGMTTGKAPIRPREAVKVSDVIEEWLKVHVERKLKPLTVRDYKEIARRVLIPEIGTKAIGEVMRADLAKLHHDRHDRPRRANYILAIARSFFTYAEEAGHRPMDTNPARRIKAYPEGRRERFLSDDELRRAAVAIDAAELNGRASIYAIAALRLCILTGARRSEICNLKRREVDLGRRMLLLEDSKTGRRPIYLNDAAIAILKAIPPLKGNDYVIVGGREGEPFKDLSKVWGRIRGSAGLDDVRLHDLRHTFASFAAAESVSLPIIGNLLGHSVPATTARYAHLAADPVRQANDKVGARIAAMMGGSGASPVEAGSGRENEHNAETGARPISLPTVVSDE